MTKLFTWTRAAWADYLYWQFRDKRLLKRINKLLLAIQLDSFTGIGSPEPLQENLAGFWSRRIDHTHRLVYVIAADKIIIISCRYHYERYD